MALNKKPLLIIDGYGFIFRAYHVQPPLTCPAGYPVGAIYGFTSMLLKLLNDFKPEFAVIVLDSKGKNFRHDLYKEYKANRPPAPEDLVYQLALVEEAAKSLNFICLSKSGYEADDIIATIACKAKEIEREAIIISSDKDLMQLTCSYIKMYDPAKSKFISEEDILAKFGVSSDKVRQVQALIGDKSDNIPGVKGIGPKTASGLVNEFGDLNNIYNNLDKLTPRQAELLSNNKENAYLSWQLVGLDSNVDINYDIEKLAWVAPEHEKIYDFLNNLGFKSLFKRVENLFNLNFAGLSSGDISSDKQQNIKKHIPKIIHVKDKADLENLITNSEKYGIIAIDLRVENEHNFLLIYDSSNIYEIQLNSAKSDNLFDFNNSNQINPYLENLLVALLKDRSLKKIGYDIKNLMKKISYELNSFEDLMLMDYLLNSSTKDRNIKIIIEYYFESEISPNDPLISYYIELYNLLIKKLYDDKLLHLYKELDLPLVNILKQMEEEGAKINVQYLKQLSNEFAIKASEIERKIFKISGEEFNINSPKQLGIILFDKLGLAAGKKNTKSQSYNTNAKTLEQLSQSGYEIADLILEYRHLSKLKSTYTDSLPKLVDKNNRIHTSFLQCATTTGRLSSINPNVQNIPIRTDEGNKIRAGFIAREGYKLISADYSQIELRILSHVADIETLKKAFGENRDIHAQTASQIFQLPLENITSELRRSAKAINFGIIYGISAFGLSKQLNISKKEASEYIKKYFKEYPGIEKYMSETIEFAKTHGYVPNAIGRKCYIATINSREFNLRSFAERAAINAPMQSLAADIVKLAMIKIDKKLRDKNFKTKMIMQIHDELIFESPDNEVELVMSHIKNAMESIIINNIKLDIAIGAGENWQVI